MAIISMFYIIILCIVSSFNIALFGAVSIIYIIPVGGIKKTPEN